MRPALLLPVAVAIFAACASTAPLRAPPHGPASAANVESGPFRMRITRAFSTLDPDGTLCASFDTVVECADGGAFPRGGWFFEGAKLSEDFFLSPGGRTWNPDGYLGAASGWSPKGYIMLQKLPVGTRSIRRVAIDLPMLEILEGESEEIRLAEGAEEIRTIGAVSYEFEASDGGLELFRYDTPRPQDPEEGEGAVDDEAQDVEGPGGDDSNEPEDPLPVGCFYDVASRPIEHAWEITDAAGRPFVEAMGLGTGVFTQHSYIRDPSVGGTVEYPLIVRWRVPRRWRATMQRFVFEDLAVPEPDRPPEGR